MALILYMTADLDALAQVSALLSARGHSVVHGGDGGAEISLELSPALVLVDTSLAAGDASLLVSHVVRCAAAAGSRPPILVLADRDHAESAVAAMKVGIEDVIFKPFDPLGLPMRVDGLLATAEVGGSRERLKTMEFRNQELESFIYIVTHDMKTPVVNLQGLVGLVEQDHGASLPSEVRDYLVRLRRNAERLEQLLRDLLEYPNRLSIVGTKLPVAVGRAAAAAVDGLLEVAQARGVDVVVAPDLPTARCDEKRLQQVFHNLVENAIKHAGDPQSGGKPRVEIGWARTADGPRFEVRDNGPGIAEDHLDEIFKLFARIPGTTSEGSGIGLAVARQLVEAHGGELWCESKSGHGTTFAFTLGT